MSTGKRLVGFWRGEHGDAHDLEGAEQHHREQAAACVVEQPAEDDRPAIDPTLNAGSPAAAWSELARNKYVRWNRPSKTPRNRLAVSARSRACNGTRARRSPRS